MLWERQDTRDVVAFRTFLFLGKVADDVAAGVVSLAHDIVQEGVDVVVQRLVVEEALAQQAQIPAPGLLAAAVNFKEGNVFVAVDFVAWWMHQQALAAVAIEQELAREVRQTHFAQIQAVDVRKLRWVRAKVPGLDLVLAHLDQVEVLDARDLAGALRHGARSAQLFDLFFLRKGLILDVVAWRRLTVRLRVDCAHALHDLALRVLVCARRLRWLGPLHIAREDKPVRGDPLVEALVELAIVYVKVKLGLLFLNRVGTLLLYGLQQVQFVLPPGADRQFARVGVAFDNEQLCTDLDVSQRIGAACTLAWRRLGVGTRPTRFVPWRHRWRRSDLKKRGGFTVT